MGYNLFRRFVYTLEIIVFYILERTPKLMPEFFGKRISFIVLILLTIALFEGEIVGLIFGVFIGFLLDSGASGSIGFYTTLMPILGYITGLISQNIINVNFSTAMLVCAACIFAVYVLDFTYFCLLHGINDAIYVFCHHYLLRILYSLLIMPVIYYFNLSIALNLNYSE